jgi:sterol desaturase/sphingolipid hydroxylase (fatty acid hydroxylase superfamily)
MAGRSRPSVTVLAVVQVAFLAFAIAHISRNGLPALGDGAVHPYGAYLALNVFSLPLATLLMPLLFTALVSPRRVTARTGELLLEVWRSSLALVPVAALLFKAFAEGWMGHLVFHRDRSLWFLILEGAGFLLLSDLWFYLSHRALHTRLLYRFHKEHHANVAPTEASAFLALSPVEAYFSGALTVSVPMMLIPVHAPVAVACAAIVLFFGFYIHAGALAGAPWLPLVNGPAHHQMHHRRGLKNANYSLLFTVFDRVFGTYVAPSAGQSEATSRIPPRV